MRQSIFFFTITSMLAQGSHVPEKKTEKTSLATLAKDMETFGKTPFAQKAQTARSSIQEAKDSRTRTELCSKGIQKSPNSVALKIITSPQQQAKLDQEVSNIFSNHSPVANIKPVPLSPQLPAAKIPTLVQQLNPKAGNILPTTSDEITMLVLSGKIVPSSNIGEYHVPVIKGDNILPATSDEITMLVLSGKIVPSSNIGQYHVPVI